MAASTVLGVLGVVRFLDIGALTDTAPPSPTLSQSISAPLDLPPTERSIAMELPTPRPDPAPVANEETVAEPVETAGAEIEESALEQPALLTALVPEQELVDEPAVAGERTVDLAEPPADVVAEETVTPAGSQWIEHVVVSGESLARIFAEHGLDAKLLHRIVTSNEEAEALAKIRPGQKLRFQFDENHELTKLEWHQNRVESVTISISDDEIIVEQVSKALENRIASAAGVIESSLFLDGQKAGLSDGQIMKLAAIFGWDIDFALEIRAGDHFRVLFEEQYLDGEKLRDGAILAAEFTNRGTTYRAVRYEDSNGEVGYYDGDGHSKRRAFIRTPIKFARVSSGYNPRRWHPVLQKWRSHKGVDYAAPTGTPVKATGDGRVTFRGTKGGYGKTVILEHAGKYTTLYAHLSKYSSRASAGKRVKQGQVIGYVGKTGLASGPHLHYEFRVAGVHQDPLRVKLPKTLALSKTEIATFRRATAPLIAKLEAIPAETMVASADTAKTN
ncbi:MAG: peptidoglycan DD-metalloendopeptidase family protein [Gammaproteobacteria bacterium]|nr:peptidoglycan DD-metalloendopeptidase family protein [Gammaproteobacteria bacterium]MCW5587201.1 peptidoglycan DD-metalloendopeptidase family protein [Chromatiales bacterium]HOP15261.1 peptidoglycan DD-metalloendopeptidase family protein [Gammaproteobacteria bacterium]